MVFPSKSDPVNIETCLISSRFQLEYIKAKQDQFITKDYIRSRKLDQSMLRFTRIFELSDGMFMRDTESEVYSTVMTEGSNTACRIVR